MTVRAQLLPRPGVFGAPVESLWEFSASVLDHTPVMWLRVRPKGESISLAAAWNSVPKQFLCSWYGGVRVVACSFKFNEPSPFAALCYSSSMT